MAIDIPSYILGKEKGGSGTKFIVEDGEATIVENGIQTFYPSDDVDGFGSFTVKVAYEHPADLIARIRNTIKEDIPYFKGKYLRDLDDAVIKEFDGLITSQFVRVLFYLTGE